MEKEKSMYMDSPDSTLCTNAKVTEDSNLGIPKPIPLIGGTEVYQKDNDTPYWYCKIKNGRDEFMHVYFRDLTENDLLYDSNGKKRQFLTNRQKKFKTDVIKALKNKPKESYRWIPVYEPSGDANNIQYVSGKNVLRKLTCYEWEQKFKEYSPENGSRQASNTTFFLLLLRWLKDGIATIEQLVDNSREIGHYWYSNDAKHTFEKTGEREFGGLYGFVGNTYKIIKDAESPSSYKTVGGYYFRYGYLHPLADLHCVYFPREISINGVGLLELTK